MNGVRVPVVAGVAGGVGCTTVAVALRARDAGRCTPGTARQADVWVSRCSGESLCRAATLAEALDGSAARPVLAVTAVGGCPARGPLQEQLRLLEQQFGQVVLLPHVGRWGELADPLAEVTMLLAQPAERLPRALRSYAVALRLVAAAVMASGRLDRRPPTLWPDLLPIERPSRSAGTPGARPAQPTRRRVVLTPPPRTVPVSRPVG